MGVGMPQDILLHEFGSLAWYAFGGVAYHVGSSLKEKSGWRDVDVRVILEDEEYERQGFGDPKDCRANHRWIAMTLAFSLLGKEMTGLPIDFQIQQQSWANATFPSKDGHRRSALVLAPHRRAKNQDG